jgi:hypothetical protein
VGAVKGSEARNSSRLKLSVHVSEDGMEEVEDQEDKEDEEEGDDDEEEEEDDKEGCCAL